MRDRRRTASKGGSGRWSRFGLVGLTLGLTGCGSVEVTPARFYRLELATSEKSPANNGLVLRVDDFSVAPHLAGDRLVAVVEGYRVVPYRDDVWVAPLSDLVRGAVLHGLLDSGRFAAVLACADAGAADLTLAAHVLNFEEVLQAGSFASVVHLAVTLRDERSDRVLWQGKLLATEPAASGTPTQAVGALSLALGKVLSRLTDIAEREGNAYRATPGK